MEKINLESWININADTINIQMPNEIFEDFGKAKFRSFNHKCFAYAYYYLICHLYRNALYGSDNTEQYSQHNIIMMFTGNKTVVSYITKSGGLLDKLEYTITTTDYPIMPFMKDGILEFNMIKDMRKRLQISVTHSPRFFVKEPVKALMRFDGEHFTGTFYSFQNTHKISIERFVKIITDSKLGHVGLFIYGFLSMMCDRYRNGYQITNEELSRLVGCGERTIQKYTQRLESIELIKSTRRIHNNKLLFKVYTIT